MAERDFPVWVTAKFHGCNVLSRMGSLVNVALQGRYTQRPPFVSMGSCVVVHNHRYMIMLRLFDLVVLGHAWHFMSNGLENPAGFKVPKLFANPTCR